MHYQLCYAPKNRPDFLGAFDHEGDGPDLERRAVRSAQPPTR